MSNKMLIDATHPEETRVVVLRGNRVEEFDFEAADRQQLRGNIYLAKVTRVEPSLQAAFVDYGGNRHGFLAFSEIHPDYYQIPFADRQALIQEQAREEEEEAAEDEAAEAAEAEAAQADSGASDIPEESGSADADVQALPMDNAGAVMPAPRAADDQRSEPAWENSDGASDERAPGDSAGDEAAAGNRAEQEDRPSEFSVAEDADRPSRDHLEVGHDEPEHVESVGAEDALEEVPERRKPRPRQYKIQEVIKRRQVLLVQVVKEERGNKGAALTTYLSLAGRYSVLMPNTGRGGGISRKITNAADRKRLKEIASELDVPQGMGVILRTAGANRTRAEVKRDFEYLLRLWENVRELTLRSSAPQLVYEEGSLIKRSIRDLYSREIEQVVVAGDDAYREAKDFMRMLMPSHARNVQQYRDDVPIFARSGVEAQLDAMFSPQVTLKSGGYIVINQTEALVSIDVNSGRSTREHSIEDTALNTNLEASEEIARQLRLRDLAGLIVIDFIDMEENRNNRAVERKLKDCLRADRARIQVGRISHFGLLEMSRQRIRTGVLESSTVLCPHCRGTGQVRSISSLSLQILRAVEEALLRQSNHHLYVRTRPDVALYVLNQKRAHLAQLEDRFGLTVTVTADAPAGGPGFLVERGGPVEERPERVSPVALPAMPEAPEDEELELDSEPEAEDLAEADAAEETGEAREPRRSRRRRRRGNGDARHERVQVGQSEERAADLSADDDESEPEGAEAEASGAERETDESQEDARRRRRGRRGGRRRGRGRESGDFAGNGPLSEAGGASELPDADFGSDEAFAPADPSEGEAPSEIVSTADGASADELRSEGNAGDELTPSFGDGESRREDREPRRDAHAEEVEALTAAATNGGEERSPPSPQPAAGSPTWGPTQAEMAAGPVGTSEPEAFDTGPSSAAADEPASGQELAASADPGEPEAATPQPVPAPEAIEDNRPKRSGWWNRRSFF